jgi:hypothetical protein
VQHQVKEILVAGGIDFLLHPLYGLLVAAEAPGPPALMHRRRLSVARVAMAYLLQLQGQVLIMPVGVGVAAREQLLLLQVDWGEVVPVLSVALVQQVVQAALQTQAVEVVVPQLLLLVHRVLAGRVY